MQKLCVLRNRYATTRVTIMDIVLLKDVEKLGQEGAVIQVKPGFARNYLIPRGLAVPATPEQLKAIEAKQRQRLRKTERAKADAEALKGKLEGRAVTLTLSLGEGDKPFGSVTVHDVVGALQRDGMTIDKHAIGLEQPIKTLGTHALPIRLHPEVTATLTVQVVKA